MLRRAFLQIVGISPVALISSDNIEAPNNDIKLGDKVRVMTRRQILSEEARKKIQKGIVFVVNDEDNKTMTLTSIGTVTCITSHEALWNDTKRVKYYIKLDESEDEWDFTAKREHLTKIGGKSNA